MTTITVPARLPVEPEPQVREGADAVLTDVRAAATAVSDVSEWARANGAPADFSGDAADAAEHAVTKFATDTAAVGAALERGALAIDQLLSQVRQRRTEREALTERRQTLNGDRDALLQRIAAASAEHVDALRADAADLRHRFESYDHDLQAWRDRVEADEDAAIRALAAVDQLTEGLAAATASTRADTAALAAELRRLGPNIDAVNAWWTSLSETERNALLISDPDLIGNTNGVPTGDRDEANRSGVQRDIEFLLGLQASGQELSASEQRWLENATSIEKAVEQASRAPYAGLGIDALVVAYQPHAFGGDGIAAVAYGDPDTADHTAVCVPGIMQDGTFIDDNGRQALNLYEETVNSLLSEAPPREGAVSTITWIGYDSPNLNPESAWGIPDSVGDVSHTITEAHARAGGVALSQFVDGLNSTHHVGAQPHLTVIGHSYGSTTSAYAAVGGMDADSLVLIGSPGASEGVTHAPGLNMPEGHVFVGAADKDPVSWLGGEDGLVPGSWDDSLGLGADPAQSDFGAHNFAVDHGQDFHGLGGLVETGLQENHVNYFDDNNPALANMADIVSGNPGDVADTGGRTQEAHDFLYDWVRGEVHSAVESAVDGAQDAWDDLWSDRWP